MDSVWLDGLEATPEAGGGGRGGTCAPGAAGEAGPPSARRGHRGPEPGAPASTERDCSGRVPPRSGLRGTAAASASFRLARPCEHLGANSNSNAGRKGEKRGAGSRCFLP